MSYVPKEAFFPLCQVIQALRSTHEVLFQVPSLLNIANTSQFFFVYGGPGWQNSFSYMAYKGQMGSFSFLFYRKQWKTGNSNWINHLRSCHFGFSSNVCYAIGIYALLLGSIISTNTTPAPPFLKKDKGYHYFLINGLLGQMLWGNSDFIIIIK